MSELMKPEYVVYAPAPDGKLEVTHVRWGMNDAQLIREPQTIDHGHVVDFSRVAFIHVVHKSITSKEEALEYIQHTTPLRYIPEDYLISSRKKQPGIIMSTIRERWAEECGFLPVRRPVAGGYHGPQ